MHILSIATLYYLVKEAYDAHERVDRAMDEGLPLTAALHTKFLCSCIFEIYPELRTIWSTL